MKGESRQRKEYRLNKASILNLKVRGEARRGEGRDGEKEQSQEATGNLESRLREGKQKLSPLKGGAKGKGMINTGSSPRY